MIVHWNVFAPTPSAVTPLVGEEAVVIVPAPLTKVQVPAPETAVFPASVAVVVHTVWSAPALAAVGALFTVTATPWLSEPQVLVTVTV